MKRWILSLLVFISSSFALAGPVIHSQLTDTNASRELHLPGYSVTSYSALQAVTNMTCGDVAFEQDNGTYWTYKCSSPPLTPGIGSGVWVAFTMNGTPTASPTPPNTFTPTPTYTSTQTFTPTPTFTGTWTPNLTLTATPTFTPTLTYTSTSTVTPTVTPALTQFIAVIDNAGHVYPADNNVLTSNEAVTAHVNLGGVSIFQNDPDIPGGLSVGSAGAIKIRAGTTALTQVGGSIFFEGTPGGGNAINCGMDVNMLGLSLANAATVKSQFFQANGAVTQLGVSEDVTISGGVTLHFNQGIYVGHN